MNDVDHLLDEEVDKLVLNGVDMDNAANVPDKVTVRDLSRLFDRDGLQRHDERLSR